MKCCHSPSCSAFERSFDASYARRDLEHYRRHGPAKATRVLLQAIRALLAGQDAAGQDAAGQDAAGQDATGQDTAVSVLDVGGGVGGVHHELRASGARRAVDVDGSSAFLAAAQDEARRLGHADRVTYLHGDFIHLADEVEPADIVALDRVICCYLDMPALVGAAADKARRVLGLVFPRDVWWMRVGAGVINLFERLSRDPLLFYVHAASAVDAVARERGLRLAFSRSAGVWQVRVYVAEG